MALRRVKWLRVVSRALEEPPQLTGNQRNPNQANSKVLSKASSIGLVLLDLLCVAVLINTVEEDGALVVLAARLGKLCTQQVEVHKAQIEVCKAYVEPHKAYVERLGGSGTRPGCSQALLEPSWSRLGGVLGHLGGVLGALGAVLSTLIAVLETSWRLLDHSWSRPESSWRCFGRLLGALGCVLLTC